jgi:hypothetical protein
MVTNAVSRCDQIMSGVFVGASYAYRRLGSGHRRIICGQAAFIIKANRDLSRPFGITPFRVRNTQYQ